MKISSYKQILALMLCMLFMVFSAAAVIILFIMESLVFKIIGGFLLAAALLCFVLMILFGRQSAGLKKLYDSVTLSGVQQIGKVYRYEFDLNYKMLGRPMLVLGVLYFDFNGHLRLIRIPTDRTKASSYPQGSNLAFKIYKGAAAVEGSVIPPQSEREFEEMIKGVDIYRTHPQTGIHCPSCGAVVNMPVHMTARCPFCDTWLRMKG